MATTRIIDLTEATALQSDDSFVIDSSRGTKKIGVGNVLDATLTEEGKFADAKAVGDALADKVDAVSGKVLSSNDYTDADKTKLAGIEAGAEVNDVTSVAGKTGAVTLGGGDVSYNEETTYADGTVGKGLTDLKSDFNSITDYTVSPNLFDVTAITNGYLGSNGNITVYSDWATTDFMPVEYGKIYSFSRTNNNSREKYSFFFKLEFDEGKNIVANSYTQTGAYTFTATSEDTKYVRISFHDTNAVELCFDEGSNINYYPYGEKTFFIKEESNTESVRKIIDSAYVTTSRNLFNVNELTEGYISNSSGTITKSGDWVTTDFIPVEYGSIYYCSNTNGVVGLFFLLEVDENGATISYTSNAQQPYSPSSANVKNIRFSAHSDSVSTLVFEKCSQPRNIYAPYGYNLIASYRSVLYGKKWVAVGDSLTEKNVSAISNYTDFISALNNMEIVNKGVGGTGYMRDAENNRAFYQRAATIPDCDIITIFGSGNDLANYSSLGDITDSTTSTICGCMNETFDIIFENHPTTPLLVIAPTPWAGNTPDMTTGMSLYCEKLASICSRRGIAYLDLFHHSGLRPDDTNQRDLVFYNGSLDGHGDYVHPNKLGHSIIAPRIMQAMESVMIF